MYSVMEAPIWQAAGLGEFLTCGNFGLLALGMKLPRQRQKELRRPYSVSGEGWMLLPAPPWGGGS